MIVYLILQLMMRLIVLSFLVLLSKGMNYGIDFTGGTLVQVQFKKQINISEKGIQNDAH